MRRHLLTVEKKKGASLEAQSDGLLAAYEGIVPTVRTTGEILLLTLVTRFVPCCIFRYAKHGF
jgi:hypothetical protein